MKWIILPGEIYRLLSEQQKAPFLRWGTEKESTHLTKIGIRSCIRESFA